MPPTYQINPAPERVNLAKSLILNFFPSLMNRHGSVGRADIQCKIPCVPQVDVNRIVKLASHKR